MQKFIVTVAGNNLTAQEVEDALYNTFTEMKQEEVIVTESK